MSLKNEILKGLLFASIGAFLFAKYSPKKEGEQAAAQEQVQECKAVVKKTTRPDGSVDEVTEFLSTGKQAQKVNPVEPKKEKLNGLGLFENEIILKRKVLQNVQLFGLDFDVDLMAKASKDNSKIGAMIEW